MSIFTTFGSFSVVAGILLIFLIFVMLSAERRSRARHRPRRRHAPRARRADVRLRRPRLRPRRRRSSAPRSASPSRYGMVSVMAGALRHAATSRSSARCRPRSLVIAYALGVLLTLRRRRALRWRVSVLNIVAAVRGLPEPIARHGGRRRLALGDRRAAARPRDGLRRARRRPGDRRSRSASRWRSSASSRSPAPPACRSASRSRSPGSLLVGWWLLPFDVMSDIAGRELQHGLLGVGGQRADARRRIDLADRLQRRPPARRHDARLRAHPRASRRC